MKNNTNNDKEMAELFYNIYIDCLKYKFNYEKQNSSRKISCHEYYDKFKFFAEKDVDSKQLNNKP